MTIFVVDNDEDLLEMMGIIFSRNQIDNICISDAGTLFQHIDKARPDAILMDIYMGPHDGRELCRRLKKTDAYKDIPVILYSAGHIPLDSIRESLANDFLSKPFNIKQLVDKVQAYV